MSDRSQTRRRYLGGLATAVAGGLAGCSGILGTQQSNESTGTPTTDTANDSSDATSESPYTQVYREVIPSVVLINVTTPRGEGQGSGFVYRDGYLVTNQHVVANASEVQVRFERGEWRTASVVGTDVSSDLAVIRVENRPDYAAGLEFIGDQPAIGTEVVALGNPFGRFDGSASAGIVSGVNRSIPAQNGFTIPDAIQTDAAVNPGNSGGPLVNLAGRVVGVINSGGGENIAFAISAQLAKRVIPALIENGEYTHAYLGVGLMTVTPALAQANGLDRARGVYVSQVVQGGPADGVLQGSDGRQRVDGTVVPTGGDIIVGIAGKRVESRHELASYLALHTSPGDTVEVTVLRNGERKTVSVQLGARPERPGAGVGATTTPPGR